MLTKLAIAVSSTISFNSANILKTLSVVAQQRHIHQSSPVHSSTVLHDIPPITQEDEEQGKPIYLRKAQLESNTKWLLARQQAEAGNLQEFIKAYRDWKNYNKERQFFYWDYSEDDLLEYAKTVEIQNFLIENGAQLKSSIYYEVIDEKPTPK